MTAENLQVGQRWDHPDLTRTASDVIKLWLYLRYISGRGRNTSDEPHLGWRIYMVGRCPHQHADRARVLNGGHDLDDAPAAFRTRFIHSVLAMFTANSAVAGSMILARGQNDRLLLRPVHRDRRNPSDEPYRR